jgi:hypothetical protein
MEVFILDGNLLRTEIVEQFESMIWTERYQGYGDFQLDIDPSLADSPLFNQGTFLGIDKSSRVMYIDSTEEKNNDDGKRVLVCKGKSLEAKLLERPNGYVANVNAAITLGNGATTPANIVRNLFTAICVSNATQVNDQMPFIQPGVFSPTSGRIAEPTDTPTIQTTIGNLYETIQNICRVYNLGFRLIRPLDDSKLYFEVYMGYDRTTSQTAKDAVVFSSALDSLTDTSELIVSDGLKNVAYVYAPNGTTTVYGNGADANTAGFDKKILVVDASDITDAAGAGLTAKLVQRGTEELAKNRILQGFDGQIPQSGSYVYGTNYELGDLVEKRSDKGTVSQMRVTEQIFVQDKTGERSYPTLTINNILVSGSWDAVSPAKNWDIYTTEVWDGM